MADERLSSLVTSQPKDELVELRALVKGLTDDVIALGRTSKKLEFNLKGTNNIKEFVVAGQELSETNQKLTAGFANLKTVYNGTTDVMIKGSINYNRLQQEEAKTQLMLIKISKEAEQQTRANIKAKDDESKAEAKRLSEIEKRLNKQSAEEKKAADAKEKALRKLDALEDKAIAHAKQLQEAEAKKAALNAHSNDSLKALSATLEQHRKSYYLLTQAERENEQIGGVLRKRIQELDAQLKLADSSIGKFTRNVGNYGAASANLKIQLSQVARELPSLANGFSTFAMAIGNNLPMAVDALARVREENAKLRADGQKTIPVWKTLLSSIFSWQTALLVLLTLLPQIGKAMTAFSGAANEAMKVSEKAVEGYAKEVTHLELLRREVENNETSQKRLKEIKAELIKDYPALKKNLEDETGLRYSLSNAIGSVTQALKLQAVVRASEDLITEATKKRLSNELDTWEIIKTSIDGTFTGTSSAIIRAAKRAEKEYEETVNRIISISDKAQKQLDSLGLSALLQPKTPKAPKVKDTSEKDAKERQRLLEEETKLTLSKTKGMYQQRAAIAKDAMEDEKRSLKERLVNLDKLMLDEVSIVKINGAIQGDTTEEIQAKVTELVLKYARLRTKITEDEAKKQADADKRARDNLSGIKTGGKTQTKEEADAERIAKLEKYSNQGMDLVQSMAAANSSLTARRIQEIDSEIEAINKRTQAELDGLEKAGASEEKKAEVKAKAEAKIKELEEDRRKRMRRAAEFEKAVTITGIIAATSLAAMKQLAATPLPAGAAALALVLGTGAFQLANAIAAPLPAYEDGVDSHPGGPARMFEGNKKELVIEPDGNAWIGAKEGIYDLKKGSQVISNKELLQLSKMYAFSVPHLIPQAGAQIDISGLKDELQGVKQAINNKPVAQLNVTGMGMQHLAKSANQITEYIKSFSS